MHLELQRCGIWCGRSSCVWPLTGTLSEARVHFKWGQIEHTASVYRAVEAGRWVGGGWIRLWRGPLYGGNLPYCGGLRDAPHSRMNPGLSFLGLGQTLNISLDTPITYSTGVFDGNNGFTDVNYCSRIPCSVLLSELALAGRYCIWRQGFTK